MSDNPGIKETEQLLISSRQVADLITRCLNPANIELCRQEIEQMLGIKDILLWRADAAASCIGSSISIYLDREVQILSRSFDAIKQGNIPETVTLLEEYQKLIQNDISFLGSVPARFT